METLLEQTPKKSQLNNKCPYCGSIVHQHDDLPQDNHKKKSKWYHSTTSVVIALLTLGPFALPMVWYNPRYSRIRKILITSLVTALTILLCMLIFFVIKQLILAIQQII